MTEGTEEQMTEDRINIDLTGIDSPYSTIPDGTYQITLADIKLGKSKTDRPMLTCRWEAVHPETGETVSMFDYPLLDQQRGKFRLRQLIIARGLDENDWTVPQLVGTEIQAEVELEDTEDYGEQNRIRQVLVEVPKAV
jgi:hypothetical protein